MVMSFIDAHRKDLDIEPICHELAIAPSSYHEHAAHLADPDKRSARARRDDEIKRYIQRVHAANFGLSWHSRSGISCGERRSLWLGARRAAHERNGVGEP
jgi:hypothetical protein